MVAPGGQVGAIVRPHEHAALLGDRDVRSAAYYEELKMDVTDGHHWAESEQPEIAYEWWHRYLYAATLVSGRAVLDIACGEGSGARLLSERASYVLGVDVNEDSIRRASSRYIRMNLEFRQGWAARLPVATCDSFDVVISFAATEFLDVTGRNALLNEAKRVLRPGGLLIISIPNKVPGAESDHNPLRKREWSVDEYIHALKARFEHIWLLGQRVYPMSYIWSLGRQAVGTLEFQLAYVDDAFDAVSTDRKHAFNVIALCSDGEPERFRDSMAIDVSNRAIAARLAETERARADVRQLRAKAAEQDQVMQAFVRHHRTAVARVVQVHSATWQMLVNEIAEATKQLLSMRSWRVVTRAGAAIARARHRPSVDLGQRVREALRSLQADSVRISSNGGASTIEQMEALAILQDRIRVLRDSRRFRVAASLTRIANWLLVRPASVPGLDALEIQLRHGEHQLARYRSGMIAWGNQGSEGTEESAVPLDDALQAPLAISTSKIDPRASSTFVPRTTDQAPESEIKLIAFYLPQFHPIPENDAWWGKGFTEWTNVVRATPKFLGHYQPRLPADLGFYDLRLIEVQEQQIALARQYGIYGFAYHHYWFSGKRLLERPFRQVLDHPHIDLPFCLSWANENWTRRWDGSDSNVLMAQCHGPEDDVAFIRDILPALRDPRYIRIEGRPLLIVYRASLLPDPQATVGRWRDECRTAGVEAPYLVAAQSFGITDPRPFGFDAAVEFPPHNTPCRNINHEIDTLDTGFVGDVWDYSDRALPQNDQPPADYTLFRSVMPSWDNTARYPRGGSVFARGTPEHYAQWLHRACASAVATHPSDRRCVFVNAWNEWGEGAYLEPDRRDGYAYLQATANVLRRFPRRTPVRTPLRTPLVSIIVPAYNHARFIRAALDSVAGQSHRSLELIVVDDGSIDSTAILAQEFARETSQLPCRVIRQENLGTHAAINAGIAVASGEYVAILNSDDLFGADRVRALLDILRGSRSALAFSNVCFIDEQGQELNDTASDTAARLRAKIADIRRYPTVSYALLDSNVAISTGNLFFERRLFDTIGGFRPLRYCTDWDFLLAAVKHTSPVYLSVPLYYYRLHAQNTYLTLSDIAMKESADILTRFLDADRSTLLRCLGGNEEYLETFIHHRNYHAFEQL
jgi:glycosyltransferase involved in cell wall biosynthesis/SAM-dependent methyltransferase